MGFLSVSKMAKGGDYSREAIFLKLITSNINRTWAFKVFQKWRGGGDYSREAIILKISVKGGRLFEGGD